MAVSMSHLQANILMLCARRVNFTCWVFAVVLMLKTGSVSVTLFAG